MGRIEHHFLWNDTAEKGVILGWKTVHRPDNEGSSGVQALTGSTLNLLGKYL